MQKIPVILDTDIGTDLDDTWALIQLLNSPELDCKLILTTGGDTLYRARLAAKLLQIAQKEHIPITTGIKSASYAHFQEPWLAYFDVDAYKGEIDTDGVARAVKIMRDLPETVYIAIGPATNAALIAAQLGDALATHKFVGMYGSVYRGYDNSPEIAPEANVKADPIAFRNVLQAPWQEIVLTPLDTCGIIVLDGSRFQQLRASSDKLIEALLENYRIWAKLVTWATFTDEDLQTKSSTLFDTVAIYLAYSEKYLEMQTIPIRVTDEGLTVPDNQGMPVRVATNWHDQDAFHDHLLDRLCNPKVV